MADFLKKLTGNRKKKKPRAQKTGAAQVQSEPIDYQERINRHKRARLLRILIALAAVVVIAALVFLYLERRSYHNYRILETSEQEDVVSTKYLDMDGKIFRYSQDGVSLVNTDLDTVWSETYSMQNPVADVRGKRAVIADKDGTTMEIFDSNGLTGTVSTSYTIVKAKISTNGLVAAILDSGDETWINFYGSDGSLIAENQTKIDDPGYPMDVAISNDGLIMMVTYQFVDGSETTSYVAFYNFGDVGQNEDDRIVSGYTYEGTVIPEVRYMSGTHSVAVRDDGFTLYEGRQIPKENKSVNVEKEIISTFYDEDTIGLVFKNEDKEKLYTMEVYSAAGKLEFSRDFNIPYTKIKISDGYIIMFNSSQIGIMNENGVTKYSGTVDGTINDIIKIGYNRYLLVLDTGVNLIKLT